MPFADPNSDELNLNWASCLYQIG